MAACSCLALVARAQSGPARAISAELKRLSPLAGTWQGKAAVAATQFRAASQSPLKASFRWVLSGQHMEGDLEYAVGGVPYHALLLLSYDFDAQEMVAQWADNFSSKPITYRGRFTGDALALESGWSEDGRTSRVLLRMNFGPTGWTLTTSSDAMGDMVEGVRLTASRPK